MQQKRLDAGSLAPGSGVWPRTLPWVHARNRDFCRSMFSRKPYTDAEWKAKLATGRYAVDDRLTEPLWWLGLYLVMLRGTHQIPWSWSLVTLPWWGPPAAVAISLLFARAAVALGFTYSD